MNKTDMLENLVNYYTDGNKAQFANMIGITPQLVSNWIKRNTFDAEIIFAKCPNVSAAWLLSGEGEMIESARNTQFGNINELSIDEHSREILRLCKSLVESYKQRDAVMDKLVSMFN